MAHRQLVPALSIAVLSLVAASDDKISWDRADQALTKATASGKPVLWYFTTNQITKDGSGTVPTLGVTEPNKLDQAFTHPVILRRKDNFVWVRADQALSNKFKIQNAPSVVFTDGDGEVIHKAPVSSPETLYEAMQKVVKEKYVNVAITWGDVVRTGPIKKKVLVVAFDDEKGEGLKVLEDRTLVKYQGHCEFVKLPYQKDGEAAKRWSVTQVPAVLICDPMEQVLERLTGKKQPLEVKAAILKALHKIDEQDRAPRK
ncbi:MAG TPA: hypothetical protein VEN81_09965 [Planctomycetota bacterium]|nr:hypothetical protein [Planctomycetota bacterium]